jgi:hypothetical protein
VSARSAASARAISGHSIDLDAVEQFVTDFWFMIF